MANLTAAEGRCLNCKTPMKAGRDDCQKCGDRVRPKFTRLQKAAEGLVLVDAPPASMSAPADHPPRKEGNVVQLTDEQQGALTEISRWFAREWQQRAGEPFYLAGPAGTGKTTLAKHLHALGEHHIVYGAYTGKAAHVLRRKGVPATTIHSAIYCPVDNKEARAELYAVQDEIADVKLSGVLDTEPQAQERLAELEQEAEALTAAIRRPGFELNPMSEWAYADLIVLDEVSMVNERMAADILSFGVPVLVLGDPAQLPPVAGEGYFTKREPDFELTEIHRQALESPVLKLATEVRLGQGWQVEKVSLDKAMQADQVIVWKNATRWNLIEAMRKRRGLVAGMPNPDDKVMCLANNKDIGMLNGMQFEVVSVEPIRAEDETVDLVLRDDDGRERAVIAYREPFSGLEGEKRIKDTKATWRGKVAFLTFADAITCHKAQGSEWSNVYVVDQTPQMWKSSEEEKLRWMYTATSRASESVTIASTRA